jgi:Flp pilus assembly protein TadD
MRGVIPLKKKPPLQTVSQNDFRTILICAVLATITFASFWQVKDSGFLALDDNMYVTENRYVQSGLNLKSLRYAFSLESVEASSNWHPLTWLSWMMDGAFFGLNPSGYHLGNLLLHVLNTILLFLILRRMTKALWPSALVAALFAVHPLHVESVAWISERKDVLSTFFWMLTLGAYTYYVERRKISYYALVLLFFVLGLMSKSMLVTLPFVLLLLDYWPLNRLSREKSELKILRKERQSPGMGMVTDSTKRKSGAHQPDRQKAIKVSTSSKFQWSLVYPLFLEKMPLFLLSVVFAVVAYLAQQKGGALSSTDSIPMFVRWGNAFIAYIAYLYKMILPVRLAVLYPHPGSVALWKLLGAISLLTGITVAVVRLTKNHPYLATGWFWYLGTLVPVIGLVQIGSQSMADRYTYVPLIGVFIMVAWGIPDLLKKVPYRKEILASAFVFCLLGLSLLTFNQVGYWKDSLTLFNRTLDVTSDNPLIMYNRGKIYNRLGHYRLAIEDNNKVIEMKPDHADAYNNRGNAYSGLGDHRRAIEDYSKAIAIKPDHADAYYNRAIARGMLSDYRLAVEDYNNAIRIDANHAEAFNNRGAAHFILGDYLQAQKDFNRAIEIKPDYAEAYYNHAVVCLRLGQKEKAIGALKHAARWGDHRAMNVLRHQKISW